MCCVYIAAASMYISVSGKQLWALWGFDGERQTRWSARLRDLRLGGVGFHQLTLEIIAGCIFYVGSIYVSHKMLRQRKRNNETNIIKLWWIFCNIAPTVCNKYLTQFFFRGLSHDLGAAVCHRCSASNYSTESDITATSIFHGQHLLGLLHCHYDLHPLPRSHVKN